MGGGVIKSCLKQVFIRILKREGGNQRNEKIKEMEILSGKVKYKNRIIFLV